MPTYSFPGASPFVDGASSAQHLDARLRARARGLEPISRIQAALGQASHAAPENRVAIISEAKAWRNVLATALEAADAAIAHAEEGLGLAVKAESTEAAPTNVTPPRRQR